MAKAGGGHPLVEPELSTVLSFSAESLVATVTSLLAEAGRADWAAFAQGSFDSWLVVPGLECVVDQLAVFT